MEIKKQIYNLSQKPIFFVSPNIDIKFDIIKKDIDIINPKYRDIFEMAENDVVFFEPSSTIDVDYLVYTMIYYLNNRNNTCMRFYDIESKIEELSGEVAFYANAFLAFYYYDNNNYEMTEPYLKFALEYVENHNVDDYDKMCIYSLTAYFLNKTKDIFVSGAESYYIEALKLIKDDDLARISILNAIAYYFHNVDKKDKAIEYINVALDIVSRYNCYTSAFTTYKNAGIIYVTKGDFVNASKYFSKAVEYSKDLNDETEYVKLLNTLGYVEFLKGDFLQALNKFEDALKGLLDISNTTKLLDEAVKTLDNIGNILKFLGDIDSSIYMQAVGEEMLENTNYINRVNEVHNLSKVYTDIGLTYLMYKSDYKLANKYFKLAKINTDEGEHYIKRNKKIVLESFLQLTKGYNKGYNKEADMNFKDAIEKFKTNGNDNLYVQLVLIEFLIYYFKITENNSYLDEALRIAKEYNLYIHYESLKDIILNEVNKKIFDLGKYPLNLLKLLSMQRREILIESKKSRDFELIEEFIVDISKENEEGELLEVANSILDKHFLSKGFIVLNKKLKEEKFNVKYYSGLNKEILNDYNKMIVQHFKNIDENQQILNFGRYDYVKSSMVVKIDDKDEGESYYFILYNDTKSDWYFTFDQLKTYTILINNLYLKYKNIQQLEKIKLSSITDYMTGFKNASYYNKRIKELIKEYNKIGKKFAIAIIDLNKFKKINDTYGHEAGDKALKHFAKGIKKKLDDGDTEFIRYGGDEFILLFDANKDMEKEFIGLKQYLEQHPLILNGDKIVIDFSYGIEIYNGQQEADFFKIADLKMYKQKHKIH